MSRLLESLLTDEQRAEAAKHDRSEQRRIVRGEPYIWPIPWRSDSPARRRDEPRPSRFGE